MQPGNPLHSLFTRILSNYIRIKKLELVSTDSKFKELLVESCTICQESIQKINELELFSKNELLEDLSTASIRYLTVPAFLAFFTAQKPDREERLTSLKLAQTYYDEFLDLIESYGIPDIPKRLTTQNSSGDGSNSSSNPQAIRRDPNALREAKIRAYKEKKALEQRLELFLNLDFLKVDEEILRDESLALVRYWAYTGTEELNLIGEEMKLLSQFPGQQAPPPPPPLTNRQPPLLITREKIRAAVFGAGYPSVPTMTLDQFVDLQVKQGLMPPPQPAKPISNGGASWRRIDPTESEAAKQRAEEKAANHDAMEDAYSEEQRSKAREFDEFKDEHRRGSGNRANRG